MHKAVPVALQNFDLNESMSAFDSVWDEALADKKRSRRRAEANLGNFIHTHKDGRSLYKLLPPPASAIVTDSSVSDFEVAFAIDVGLPVPIAGRIDGLCQHRDSGKQMGWEFKTASRLTSSFFDCFEYNVQVLSYALALNTMTQIDGFIVEGMLVDPKKVDCLAHPVYIQEHQLKAIHTWLNYYGSLLLACEAKFLSQGVEFPQDFTGCSAYTHYYMPMAQCEFNDLCRVEDWRSLASIFNIKPEHNFMDLSVKET